MLWKSSYATGIDEIDRQNFELIIRIGIMMHAVDNKAKLTQLENFEELVKKYFDREQRLHNKNGYFDADKQKNFHETYIRKLQHTKQHFVKTGITFENKQIFRTNAVELLQNHILYHDKLFALIHCNLRKNVNIHGM